MTIEDFDEDYEHVAYDPCPISVCPWYGRRHPYAWHTRLFGRDYFMSVSQTPIPPKERSLPKPKYPLAAAFLVGWVTANVVCALIYGSWAYRDGRASRD